MSTILKALRRLEEEKRSSEERPLREEVATGQPVSDAGRRPSRLPWLVGLALLLAVGLGVWSQWPLGGGEEPVDVAAQPEAVPTPPAPRTAPSAPPRPVVREAPRPAPPPATEAPETPAQAFASEVEVVARPAASPRSPIEMSPAAEARAEASEPEPEAPAPRRSEPEPEAPAVVAKAEASAPPAPSPPAPVVERPAPEPEPTSSWRAESSPPAPEPVEEASSGADLSVERTLWHPRAERRAAFVALGGEPAARVEEGDVLGRYVVSEIQPTGVVFLRDGKPVERKVGAR